MTTSSSTTYSCADGSDPDSEHKCGAVAGTAATPTCNTAEGWALNTETNMCDKADNDSVEPTYSCADESTPNASHMCGAVAGTPATETTETTSTCPESNRVTIDRNGTAGYPDFFLVAEKDGSTTYAKAAANK